MALLAFQSHPAWGTGRHVNADASWAIHLGSEAALAQQMDSGPVVRSVPNDRAPVLDRGTIRTRLKRSRSWSVRIPRRNACILPWYIFQDGPMSGRGCGCSSRVAALSAGNNSGPGPGLLAADPAVLGGPRSYRRRMHGLRRSVRGFDQIAFLRLHPGYTSSD